MSPGVPDVQHRRSHQRVPLHQDRPAGVHRTWRSDLCGGEDGRSDGGRDAPAQRRRHCGHGARCGADEVRVQGQVSPVAAGLNSLTVGPTAEPRGAVLLQVVSTRSRLAVTFTVMMSSCCVCRCFRIAVFSITVLHDERIVVVAEQRPDSTEEDSFQWMSRVLQVHIVHSSCMFTACKRNKLTCKIKPNCPETFLHYKLIAS